jgi:hypothetical protein
VLLLFLKYQAHKYKSDTPQLCGFIPDTVRVTVSSCSKVEGVYVNAPDWICPKIGKAINKKRKRIIK